MPNLSKIKLNGTIYYLKDAQAREDISELQIPTALSELLNDEGYIKSYTETDPIFTASVAAGITSSDITNWNNKLSSAPVTSVNSKTGAVVLKTSDLQNDSGYLTLATLPIYDGTVV